MYLIKNGVPWDVAFGLFEDELLAAAVVMKEFESGRTFDWSSMTFLETDS
jgi:hypothetical protein